VLSGALRPVMAAPRARPVNGGATLPVSCVPPQKPSHASPFSSQPLTPTPCDPHPGHPRTKSIGCDVSVAILALHQIHSVATMAKTNTRATAMKTRKTATKTRAAQGARAARGARRAAPSARRAAPSASAARRARRAAPSASAARRARRAAPSARAAPRARAPKAVGGLSADEQAEYTRLRKKIRSRLARAPGSNVAEVMKEIDDAATPADRLKMARVLVGPGRRPPRRDPEFQPSAGHQIHDRISWETLRVPVVRKGLAYTGLACERTLAVYAVARRLGLEEDVPLPRLYQVSRTGDVAYFDVEYMGPDAHVAGVARREFLELKRRSIADLRRLLGVVPKSVSVHFKNWCVTARPNEVRRRAYLIDLGNVCLRGARLQRESS
jgi:hypothetical protein